MLIHEKPFPKLRFLVRYKSHEELVDYDDIDEQYQRILYDVFDREHHENQDDQHRVQIHTKEHD